MSSPDIREDFSIPNDVPICQLNCTTAFRGLEEREQKYAHYLGRACNEGGVICLFQTSPESPAIFDMFQKLFCGNDFENIKKLAQESNEEITDECFQSFLTYVAGVYSNLGNYRSFGDTKIVPAISKELFKSILYSSELYKQRTDYVESFWREYGDAIYNLDSRRRELGLGEKGVSTYYSSDIREADIVLVQEFMKEKKLSPYNTRLFRKKVDNKTILELKLASVAGEERHSQDDDIHALLGEHMFNGHHIQITRGDYSTILKKVNENLLKAREFASNETEVLMLENYIKCFLYGSIEFHKEGSRNWIKNKGPIVEMYIGFIESYRDPFGVRGEYEGFVSMVNKEMSAKFGELVSRAEEILQRLPWPATYEKDKFLKPDFTSLDVLNFSSSGIPVGINIPNYDDIRQNEGFKNVSLGNVLQAYTKDQKVTFLSEELQEMYSKLKSQAFEVQVGLHELLGHGSGKLFRKEDDGSFNFDTESVKHLLSGEKITTWYNPGETWDTKFKTIASNYEECRAECVGLHLCLERDILRIFGHEGEKANDILYINWLNMVRAGLLALEYYSPETSSWKQAHMNARYVILQVLLEAGEDLINIGEITGNDELPDLLITLDKTKIETVGKKAISNFLMKLQLYKSTADVVNGQKMFDGYSTVSADMLEKRKIVLSRKQPRRMFVQYNTRITGNGLVELLEYPGTVTGLIQSVNERYKMDDDYLQTLWEAEKVYHNY